MCILQFSWCLQSHMKIIYFLLTLILPNRMHVIFNKNKCKRIQRSSKEIFLSTHSTHIHHRIKYVTPIAKWAFLGFQLLSSLFYLKKRCSAQSNLWMQICYLLIHLSMRGKIATYSRYWRLCSPYSLILFWYTQGGVGSALLWEDRWKWERRYINQLLQTSRRWCRHSEGQRGRDI